MRANETNTQCTQAYTVQASNKTSIISDWRSHTVTRVLLCKRGDTERNTHIKSEGAIHRVHSAKH